MPFVTEKVSAEDKARIDWESIPCPGRHFCSIRPSRWTIDRDRDVFLMYGTQGREESDNQYHFLFWWKGTPTEVYLIQTFLDKNIVEWRLQGFRIPKHLTDKRGEMLQALEEALTVWGVFGDLTFGDPAYTTPVEVSFIDCTSVVGGAAC